jgi:hypothetical protein
MRILLAVAFLVVTSVAAFTYRDLILDSRRTVQRPEPPRPVPVVLARPVAPEPIRRVDPATIAVIAAIDSMATAHILAIQNDSLDSRSMTELAFLYMKQGWFDRAIGPLARAREIDATSEPLQRYLDLAIARSGLGFVDVYQAAREFEDIVAVEGHGC